MNKQEFITHIANQHDCTKVEAEKAIYPIKMKMLL